jgi:hypothetical protein
MGIVSTFFNKIKALLSKKDIEFSISNAHDIIDELKLLITQYALFYKENKPKNQDIKFIIDSFYKSFVGKIGYGKNIFEDIASHLENLEKNIEVIGEYIEKQMTDKSVGSALSLKKGFCVAFINNTEFCLDYLQKFLDYYADRELGSSSSISKADVAFIEGNIKRFTLIFGDLTKPTDKFEKEFSKLVDVVITEDNEGLIVTENKSEFNINSFMGFRYSPLFFLGRIAANYQVDKYKARKEKIKYLQLRLMHLENEARQTPDPRLEKEIELLKNRIDKLESANHEVERDLEEGNN